MSSGDEEAPVSEEFLELLPTLQRATSLVVNGGFEDFDPKNRESNRVLAQTSDQVAIDQFLDGLAFGEGPRMDWMTPGSPTLVLLEGRTVLASIRCLFPGYIRCAELWEGDVPLISERAIQSLLVDLAAQWLDSEELIGKSIVEKARHAREDFQLSSMSTYRALRRASYGYEESKVAVNQTMTAQEQTATEALWDVAEGVLDEQ